MKIKTNHRVSRLAGLVLGGCLLAAALAGPAGADTTSGTTITFQEPEKGSTFAFIDNAPHTTVTNNGPKRISAGDQIVVVDPLVAKGKQIGHLRAVCIATNNTNNFSKAGFVCDGTFVFAKGTLVGSVLIEKSKFEGAITGGTGIYANAHGIFVSKESKGFTTTTITLVP